MAGLGVRLFTDEHVYSDLARALRRRGYDAESCQDAEALHRRRIPGQDGEDRPRTPDERDGHMEYAQRDGNANNHA